MSEDQPRWQVITFWVICIVLAAMFLLAGGGKLAGDATHIENFARWGYPDWFRLVVGAGEVVSALLLLYPRTRFYGGFILSGIMVGAFGTHVVHSEPAYFPVVGGLFLFSALVAWFHRQQFTERFLKR